jgi:outer membrane protein OmpA-like peptidoglycan-associated protein
MSADARRDELLGKTPLVFPQERMSKAPGVIVQRDGYEPALVYLPARDGADLDVHVTLRPLDQAWVDALPKDVAAKLHSTALSDLLAFQTELYSLPQDQLQVRLGRLQEQYGHLAAFHYLVGNYHFYRNNFSAAAQSYAKAVEIDPDQQRYKDMVLLNQMRSMEATKVVTIKAFEALGLAARRIASSLGGSVVATRSHPELPEPDGFRILIPTDPVFRPASPKLKPSGLKTIELVAKELQSLTKSFAVKVGVHTGSDPREEFDVDQPVVFKGNRPTAKPWQLSGERAVAVMALLRSQGVLASSWSIAGYGDGNPLVTDGGLSAEDLKRSGLNRRIELDISFFKGPTDKPFNEKDFKSLKRSLEFFLSAEDGQTLQLQPGQQGSQGNGGRQGSGKNQGVQRTPGSKGSGSQGSGSGANGVDAEELARKRKALENRLQKPRNRSGTESGPTAPSTPGGQDLPVPQPRAPKID